MNNNGKNLRTRERKKGKWKKKYKRRVARTDKFLKQTWNQGEPDKYRGIDRYKQPEIDINTQTDR